MSGRASTHSQSRGRHLALPFSARFAVASGAADTEEDDEDTTKPLPDRLITELTAHRTLALRDALAENPALAFQAVLHNFVLTALQIRIVGKLP